MRMLRLLCLLLFFAVAGCFGHRNVLPLVADRGDNAWDENLTRRWFLASEEKVTAACRRAADSLGWRLTDRPDERPSELALPIEDAGDEFDRKSISFENRELSKANWEQTLETPQGQTARLYAITMGPRGVKLVILWREGLSRSTTVNLSNRFFNVVETALAATAE